MRAMPSAEVDEMICHYRQLRDSHALSVTECHRFRAGSGQRIGGQMVLDTMCTSEMLVSDFFLYIPFSQSNIIGQTQN